MEVKVRKIGDEYGIILPQSLLDNLTVRDGSLLNAESHNGVLRMTPVDAEFSQQIEAFQRTEGQHRHSYLELSK